MNLPDRVTLPDDVLFQEVLGEYVLLNIETEKYFGLGGTGARLWQLFAEDSSVPHALAAIVSEYDVDAETAERDLAAFLGRLAAAQLIVPEA
jgi:hypothetical protein